MPPSNSSICHNCQKGRVKKYLDIDTNDPEISVILCTYWKINLIINFPLNIRRGGGGVEKHHDYYCIIVL